MVTMKKKVNICQTFLNGAVHKFFILTYSPVKDLTTYNLLFRLDGLSPHQTAASTGYTWMCHFMKLFCFPVVVLLLILEMKVEQQQLVAEN